MASYDLVVLGGGSGGVAAARRARRYGAKVVLVESQKLGGTCVHVGCVPKKITWHAASIAEELADARDYGFDLEIGGFDLARLKERRNAYIARLEGIYTDNLEREGGQPFEGMRENADFWRWLLDYLNDQPPWTPPRPVPPTGTNSNATP